MHYTLCKKISASGFQKDKNTELIASRQRPVHFGCTGCILQPLQLRALPQQKQSTCRRASYQSALSAAHFAYCGSSPEKFDASWKPRQGGP
jgi:hypothetical protein